MIGQYMINNTYIPSFKTVELCLTYRCNVKCANCSNLCTQAPTTGDLTPEQVQYFINDSLANNHVWEQITIHGGEPVLNPWVYEIVRVLVEYRKTTGCIIWLLSNNSTRKIREDITRISDQYDIPLGISEKHETNINKSGDLIQYIPVNESPIDSGIEYTYGCFQSKHCGLCYNNIGYFPCSPMAAAARVFNYKSAADSIGDLTKEKCQEYFEMHCKYCGFAAIDSSRVVEQVTSKSWEKVLKNAS
jgi:hypothetical protein